MARSCGRKVWPCITAWRGYADQCWRGASRIWSLRVHRGEKVRHVLTIQVDINAAPSFRHVAGAIAWRLESRFGCCRIGQLESGFVSDLEAHLMNG
jgi:hypothetical protein